jgi:hypothetical protein
MEGIGYVIDVKVVNGEGCKKILRVVGRARKELAGAVRQYAPLKHRSASPRLLDALSQKAVIFESQLALSYFVVLQRLYHMPGFFSLLHWQISTDPLQFMWRVPPLDHTLSLNEV